MGTRDVTSQVLSADGKLFVGAERWMPGSRHELTMTITPNGSPGPLKLVVEALPHQGIDHALDVLSFESGTHGNTPPTLALNTIPQITREALPFGPLWFTCGDAETDSATLVVTTSSSDTLLVPNNNITLGQNGLQRWLRVVPATGRWGITNISVTVSDGVSSVTKSFALTVDRTTVLPVVKANNPLNLEVDTSWQGSVKPGPANQAVWDATVTGPNAVNLAANFGVGGLRIANPGGDVAINGTSTLSIGIAGIDMASSTRNLTLNVPMALDESAEWKIATSRLVRVTQGITGIGGIAKSGSGQLELLGNDSFTGQLSTNGGVLLKSGSGAQSATMVTDNARFRASHSGAFGAGDLGIGAANNYTGGIVLSGDISVLAGKSVTVAARNSNTDAVSSISGNNTFGGNVMFGTGGVFYGFSSSGGHLTLSGNFSSKATGSRIFTLRGTGDGRMTGKISDGSGVVGLIKSGSGTWSLAGVHTFSGAVSHQEGTLGIFSPLPKQAVTVDPGAVLTGNGTLGGTVSLSGIHSPGDGVGSQSIQGPLSYQDTARIRWEIGGQSPSGDLIVAATVTAASGASIDVVANPPGGTVDFTLPFWREARTWPVLTATSIAGSFTLNSGTVDSIGGPSLPYGDFNLVQTPASVSIQWTPAPPFRTWQYVNFGTSWDNPSIAGADQDPDADGWSNENEWITGTDPKQASSRFTATLDRSGLLFNRVEGRNYRIETTANLQDGWTTHANVPSGSGPVTIPIMPTGEPRRFYRVAVTWNP
jgi:autotransporter-associated beta strand protein